MKSPWSWFWSVEISIRHVIVPLVTAAIGYALGRWKAGSSVTSLIVYPDKHRDDDESGNKEADDEGG
ncbi:MAG TPA: hypothetical protein VFA29_04840 [Candidatus Baltobacteraceae bacterium]|nr:hypothetical protein [Candidatus Baltobacteraceae bacterium]